MTDFPPEEILTAYVENLIVEEMERREPGIQQRIEEESRIQQLHANICNYTGSKYDPEP